MAKPSIFRKVSQTTTQPQPILDLERHKGKAEKLPTISGKQFSIPKRQLLDVGVMLEKLS
ncbi:MULTISPECIES: hypothetical protein [Moorena]|uniref:Uncharacterized protein n=1 Tax=Moorena bouillonii PNG TaxID=568701 RepID=A0A1U7N896_9CYAN|nr:MULTISPECIES: hypothetical protein [Moorena]NEO19071.1 hypothetical protein [Moorena sp. SIO4A5]NEQ56413.1 hypothetical protein [Moorena sp. SIO4A1]OLT62178.1 hypothetical protein BJP37_27320 [Moorena bouillonii PNG]